MISLEEFGLSLYEIKVYKELLKSSVLNARELSNKSYVPYGRIYDVLNSLEYKGLLEKQLSRPAKYMAIEPKIALKKLIQHKKEEVDSLTHKAKDLEKELYQIYRKPLNESLFWSIALGHERTQLRIEKLEEVESELLMYVEPYQDKSLAKKDEVMKLLQTLKKLIQKEVKIKILMGYNKMEHIDEILSLSEPFKEHLEKIQVRLIKNISIPFDIIDDDKVHIKVRNPAKPDEFFASIYFWQKSFAEELREKFNEMWIKGDKIKN